MKISTLAVTAIGLVLAAPSLANAQRTDTTSSARLFVRDTCILTPSNAVNAEVDADKRESAFALALATVGAKVVGDLATSAINAAGDALVKASQEQGFIAEGSGHYSAYQVRLAADGRKNADLETPQACLILVAPSTAANPVTTVSAQALKDLDAVSRKQGRGLRHLDDGANLSAELASVGALSAPAVYVEAMMWSSPDGLIVRPVLVWYQTPLPGAPPAKPSAAELHVTLATPGNAASTTSLGAPFAVGRIRLPKLAPGTAIGVDALAGYDVISLPSRPSAGSPDTALSATNAVYTAAATANAEAEKAASALVAAQRKLAKTKTAENEEAVTVAEETKAAKVKAAQASALEVGSLPAPRVGATNAQLRFVVIKDANKFGLAIGAALKSHAAEVGTAVTAKLTPKAPTPEWSATDTAYVTAINNVGAKQREIDGLSGTPDPTASARLNDELTVLKARANEAAVTAGYTIPYPGLLPSRT